MKHLFSIAQRVYIEHTDAGGVVYHSNYLNFMERARTDFVRLCGYEHQKTSVEDGFIFVVHSLDIRYKSPLQMDEEIVIALDIQELKRSSVTFAQYIYHKQDMRLACSAAVRVCSVSSRTLKPQAIPVKIFNRISEKSTANSL
ncbi:YbgC/FadM family acyl-CoA thioesterase [Gynuella sunshinyii]|uniref:Putative thioesterase n=1 Tax=Gynuella sunshinyii YC6258 TaxID=1445510 RepID=A0A0C5VK15_9GAMM|nr:YbgC/FadM family acyl-CoA thioesterase [Gynuella sunshinyii]AJQ94616.1 putative thioesterase [Gynuella sunshinyii YC6258]